PHMQAAERFAGSGIVQQRNCVTCHTIGQSGGTVGPILNQISDRRTEDWLRTWFKNPNSLKSGTKMPNFQFSESELDELLSHLTKMKRGVDGEALLASNPDPVRGGEALFEAYDCYACHRIGDRGRFVGPNLTWIGLRKSKEWETLWLKDPPAYKPGTFMPNFHLSAKEIEALTSFLHSLQGQSNEASRKWESITAFILDARPKERGRLVAERLACWSCHGEDLSGGVKNPNAGPDGFVPAINSAFMDFEERDLRAFILQGSAPEKLAPEGEAPPFACPPWKAALTESELDDLLAYLESMAPESEKWEFQ
ncbi:MAG: c-type cytochrome, partial [Candidatus Zixiibacteriota bacterium]